MLHFYFLAKDFSDVYTEELFANLKGVGFLTQGMSKHEIVLFRTCMSIFHTSRSSMPKEKSFHFNSQSPTVKIIA